MRNSINYIIALGIAWTFLPLASLAQSVNVPLNKDYYHLIERYQVKCGLQSSDFAMKPWQRKNVALLADFLRSSDTIALSQQDAFNLEYLAQDNWEWSTTVNPDSDKPTFKHFYKKKSDLFHYADEDFQLHINPVLHVGMGRENDIDEPTFINTRGLEVRGQIANSLGFYTYVGENQARFPTYVREYIEQENFAIPGEGFWKDFKEGGVDFLTGRAYITFDPVEKLNVQFGYDRNFIGHGYRSLLLSDFSTNYLFLKFDTQIGKRFQLTNLFTELRATAFAGATGSIDGEFPKKYMTLHRFGFDVTPNLNIGVFEQIIYGDENINKAVPIKIAYFNPVIFTRSLFNTNEPGENKAAGLDARWNLFNTMSVYGTAYFDGLQLREFGNGAWNNNIASQIGVKYFDVLDISNLDIQAEVNHITPYTYARKNYLMNAAHFRQPLAHPMGANLREVVGILRYQPIDRLSVTAKAIITKFGGDLPGQNFGGDVMRNTDSRVQDFDNEVGQGNSSNLQLYDFTASYMLKHNLFVDLRQTIRNLSQEVNTGKKENTTFTQLLLRWNIPHRDHEF